MLGNEGNAKELVSERALQRAQPGQLNVPPQQCIRVVQKPKPGLKSAGEKTNRKTWERKAL